jgi:hypothetical protein
MKPMRFVFFSRSLGAIGLAGALLAACGGNSALAPIASGTQAPVGASSPGGLSGIGGAPTPVVIATPTIAPTPSTSATPISGLPSPVAT